MSRRSVRTERRLFLADGPKAVEGALEVPGRVVEVFATPAAAEQYDDLLAGVEVTLVEHRALGSLSDAVNPAGVVAVCRMFDESLDALVSRLGAGAPRTSTSGAGETQDHAQEEAPDDALVEVRAQRASKPSPADDDSGAEGGALVEVRAQRASKPSPADDDSGPEGGALVEVRAQRASKPSPADDDSGPEGGALVEVRAQRASKPSLLVICADVRDPGNAGTVVRCADAAGADGVVLAGDSVDPYNPKTVRASVGSLFHVPFALERDPAVAVRAAQEAGLTVLAADGGGEVDLFEADELLARPTAWLLGNEAWGLPPELAALADHRVRIPIHGRAESLNLATAAAVCLYASARVHRS